MQDEIKINDIQNFPKTVGFHQKYIDIKTPAPGFDFEMCSVHVYSTKSKPFGKSICLEVRVPQINQCMGNAAVA